jgi:hypothetical protein
MGTPPRSSEYRKSRLLSCAFTASMGFSLSEGRMATFRRVSTVFKDEEEIDMTDQSGWLFLQDVSRT